MITVGEFLTAINFSKVDIVRESDNPDLEIQHYPPFVINKCLSHNFDSAQLANILNKSPNLDRLLQYDFLRLTLSKGKRYGSAKASKETTENLELVMEYYNYNKQKALGALKCLSKDDLEIIKQKMDKGTINE